MMKLLKIAGVLVALAGIAVLAIVIAASVGVFSASLAQGRQNDVERRQRELTILSGRGAAIGVSIRDVVPAEAGGDTRGVVIDEVRPDSPADKAGMKRGDIVVEFDGEQVRSARQFTRLVQETTPGRTVKATIVRDGRRSDVQITPSGDGRRGDVMVSGDFGDYMRDFGRDLGRLGDHLPPFNFNFDFDFGYSGRRLGVTVNELTAQLADYFGARDGLLVTSVTDGSPASRAGLRAGDVITSIDGRTVRSREDLLRALREATARSNSDSADVTIGIVRDKKESSVKATIESPRRASRARPA